MLIKFNLDSIKNCVTTV